MRRFVLPLDPNHAETSGFMYCDFRIFPDIHVIPGTDPPDQFLFSAPIDGYAETRGVIGIETRSLGEMSARSLLERARFSPRDAIS
jgi:hypothetical protein